MNEKLKSAALLAVQLRLGSWDGMIFRMNSYSASNHACKLHGIDSGSVEKIRESIDNYESIHQSEIR